MIRTRSVPSRPAFTIVELLIVIGIIAVLISILIPVVSTVRSRAHDADTRNWISQISAATERYQQDHRAYPGPIPDDLIYNSTTITASAATGFVTTWSGSRITGSENLTLGLLGGMKIVTGGAIQYDPSLVGLGPLNINLANPKRNEPYIDQTRMSWRTVGGLKTGRFVDDAGFADDTIIPEFVDAYPSGPMPLLYIRAKRGVAMIQPAAATPASNSVITNTIGGGTQVGAYDLRQIIGYTGSYDGTEAAPVLWVTPPNRAGDPPGGRSIGVGKVRQNYYNILGGQVDSTYLFHGLRTVNTDAIIGNPGSVFAQFPFNAFPYIANPALPNTAKNADSYILISAGRDRIYGTRDDIVNFGAVGD